MAEQVPMDYCILGKTDIAPTGYSFTGDKLVASPSWKAINHDFLGLYDIAVAASQVTRKIYLFEDNLIHEYDPATDSSVDMASSPPTPRRYASAAAYDGKIYLMGGSVYPGGGIGPEPNTDRNEAYDPLTDTWSAMADIPEALGSGNAITYQNEIYVFGPSGVHVYSPDNNSWTTKNSTPGGSVASSATVKGRLHIFDMLGNHYVYRKPLDAWVEKAAMPNPRMRSPSYAAVGIDGKIYVAGGIGSNSDPIFTTDVYDPDTDSWTVTEPLPQDSPSLFDGCRFEGKLYTFGYSIDPITRYFFDPSPDYYIHKVDS